jgi:IclR family transcriptional regulator, mhp operon transcriptional activator
MKAQVPEPVIEPIRRAFSVLQALNRRRSTTLVVLAAETGQPRPTWCGYCTP